MLASPAILQETLPLIDGKQRVRGLLCILLKCNGKQHVATRTVIKHLLKK